MPSNRRRWRPKGQLADLVLIQLSNWRWAWPQLVLVGMITPVVSMLALTIFTGGHDHEAQEHILVGILILALLFQNQNQVAGNFSFMKMNGTLDFFAALPVSRVLLAVATVSAFCVLSLPALLVTVGVGTLIVHVGLSLNPLLLVVVPLCVIPAAAIGAIIGSLANSIEESTSISLVMTFILTGCGPVLFPPSRLPGFVQVIGRFNPATYAESALQATLIGPVGPHLAIDAGVLAAFAAASLLLMVTKMPWRAR